MKSILFLICTFSAHLALATQAYSGFVNRMNTSYFFQTAGTTAIYRIEVGDAEVQKLFSAWLQVIT